MTKLEKAFLAIKGKQFPVMYNPTDYSTGQTAVYGGPDVANNQFQRVKLTDFTLSLFFDTYDAQSDVRTAIQPIADLIKPTVKKRKFKEPPICTFVWGKFSFRGVVKSITQNFTMFLGSGVPVRANVTMVLESRLTPQQTKDNSNRSSSRKFWTVKTGDRLDRVAQSALDDPAHWRLIAAFNNIEDPLTFPEYFEKGRQIVIPDIG